MRNAPARRVKAAAFLTASSLACCVLAQPSPPAAPSIWAFYGSALASDDSTDPAGWIRLTPNAANSVGMALSRLGEFDARKGVTVNFLHAAWGGGSPSGDGIAVFLFDPSKGMSGGEPGAGLGYCGAPGGWLAVGLDEYGNFSHPLNRCGNGPGRLPSTLVIRGPVSQGARLVAAVPVPAGVDRPEATGRSGVGEVSLYLWPNPAGYTVAVDWRPAGAVDWRPLVERAEFPFPAPNALGLGATGSTGSAKNVHEVGRLRARLHTGVAAALRFEPASVPVGAASTLTFELGGGGRSASILMRPMTYELPPGLEFANPAALGGSCAATVRAQPQSRTLTVEKGSVVRPGGCTVSVNVVARSAGTFAAALPAGSLLTDSGTNLGPAASSLAVGR